MRVHHTLLFVGILVTVNCGGTGECTDEAVAGLEAIVFTDLTGNDCPATVIAEDDEGYREELSCSTVDGGCDCTGLVERPGTYTVTVTLEDAQESTTVTIEDDGCHPIPERVCFFGDC